MDSKYVDKVNQAIAAILENKKIEATVLNQSITKSQKESNKTGLELAAARLQEIDNDISLEKIEKMTVKEFINYSRSKDIAIEDLFKIVEGNRKEEYKVEKDNEYKEEKPTSSSKKISAEAAKKIAMDKVGGGKITEFELDDDEYEVEIEYNGKEYEMEIDIYTGEIKEYKVEKDDDYKEEKPTSPSKKISAEAAKKIAMDKVGGGKITEFELDDDEYEVEIEYNGKEYEMEIDIYTGEIKEYKVEKDDDYKEEKPTNPSKKKISVDAAKKIAMDKVGGGKITEFEIDDDEYEIEIEYNGKEYELEIDIYTGEILDFEVEDMDD